MTAVLCSDRKDGSASASINPAPLNHLHPSMATLVSQVRLYSTLGGGWDYTPRRGGAAVEQENGAYT
jgi:hypothetical protein